MRIFITGITGFVGINLAEELVNRGYGVIGFLRKDVKTRKPCVFSCLRQKNVKTAYGDITSYKSILENLNKISKEDKELIIIHLAALPNLNKFDLLYEVNVKGTENLYKAVLEADIYPKRIIHFSTASIFGPHHSQKITEKYNEFNPETFYEKTKYRGEKIAEKFMKENDLPITILRPVHVYGPHHFDPLITRMIKMVKRGFVLAPPPTLPIDLVYVKNLVGATILIMEKEKAMGKTYLVTDRRTYTIREILDTVNDILGKQSMHVYLPKSLIKIYSAFTQLFRYSLNNVTFSCDKIVRELGYVPQYDLKKGLSEYIDWLKIANGI